MLLELLIETYSSIRQHKSRPVLTGSGITWGILILVILLGIGNGFGRGMLICLKIMHNSIWMYNSIWITGYYVKESRERQANRL